MDLISFAYIVHIVYVHFTFGGYTNRYIYFVVLLYIQAIYIVSWYAQVIIYLPQEIGFHVALACVSPQQTNAYSIKDQRVRSKTVLGRY